VHGDSALGNPEVPGTVHIEYRHRPLILAKRHILTKCPVLAECCIFPKRLAFERLPFTQRRCALFDSERGIKLVEGDIVVAVNVFVVDDLLSGVQVSMMYSFDDASLCSPQDSQDSHVPGDACIS